MKPEEKSALAANYKKRVVGAYVPISSEDIDAKVSGNEFVVTRKYDGELAVIFFEAGKELASFEAYNSRGKLFPDVPVFTEASYCLGGAKIKKAVIAAELYADEKGGRARVGDVRKALADKKKAASLRLAPFDIISLNGEDWKGASYAETWKKLDGIFGKKPECAPVKMETARTKDDIKKIFEKWVAGDGSEGVVVHSELPVVYKIKPKYSVDAAIVGFSEGDKGAVRSLLYAVMTPEGEYQIFAHGGGGLSDDMRKKLFAKLSKKTAESKYISTDSNHVAFRMVKPETVAEISAVDIVGENSSGVIRNPLLAFDKSGWSAAAQVAGVSLISPNFERIRDDKEPNKDDIRIAQIADCIASGEDEKAAKLEKSELIKREVYTKKKGDSIMVLKFLLWKTNKEKSGDYPAYVFTCTNFSPDRADALQIDGRISNDKKQIEAIWDDFIEKNVKKGWEKQ